METVVIRNNDWQYEQDIENNEFKERSQYTLHSHQHQNKFLNLFKTYLNKPLAPMIELLCVLRTLLLIVIFG